MFRVRTEERSGGHLKEMFGDEEAVPLGKLDPRLCLELVLGVCGDNPARVLERADRPQDYPANASAFPDAVAAGSCELDCFVQRDDALTEVGEKINLPRFRSEGIDEFAGPVFHSARWNHEADLDGRRVAIIGTGASAIQVVPELARTAARLDVYQRTAPWVEEKGLDHIRDVVCDDSLGLAQEFEAAIARHVEDYACEWKGVLDDPDKLARFVSFVNAPDVEDPTVTFTTNAGRMVPTPLGLPKVGQR